jgi:hypothetical protein
MSLTLTTPYALPNGTRLIVASARPDDDNQVLNMTIEMRSAPGTDIVVSTKSIAVRNGLSDRVKRNSAPVAGTMITEAMLFESQAVSTPTGYTDAMNAIRAAANTPTARRAALEAAGLTAGWIDASLTGT